MGLVGTHREGLADIAVHLLPRTMNPHLQSHTSSPELHGTLEVSWRMLLSTSSNALRTRVA